MGENKSCIYIRELTKNEDLWGVGFNYCAVYKKQEYYFTEIAEAVKFIQGIFSEHK